MRTLLLILVVLAFTMEVLHPSSAFVRARPRAGIAGLILHPKSVVFHQKSEPGRTKHGHAHGRSLAIAYGLLPAPPRLAAEMRPSRYWPAAFARYRFLTVHEICHPPPRV